MPRCGATFDEKRPPLDKGGLQGGFEPGNNPSRRSCRCRGELSPTNTAHQPPSPWPLAPASPPRLRRGAHFQGSFHGIR